jgi:hypothetical protein
MPDKYDEAIEFLAANPGKIYSCWMNPSGPHGSLFQWLTPDGDSVTAPANRYGCLTQIKNGVGFEAWTPELTARIVADPNVPWSAYDLSMSTPDEIRRGLAVFAEYQREADRTFRLTAAAPAGDDAARGQTLGGVHEVHGEPAVAGGAGGPPGEGRPPL